LSIIRVKGVNYKLSLYFSYLLPTFNIVSIDPFMFIKEYGVCKGLKCVVYGDETECLIPGECSGEIAECILGLNTWSNTRDFLEEQGLLNKLKFIEGITVMNNPFDKFIVFTCVFLSRNTDYYLNTVKWLKIIMDNNCFNYVDTCFQYIRSYQYMQYSYIIPRLKNIMDRNLPIKQELHELIKLDNVGLKTINAYALHCHGDTRYAPVDRYYKLFLSEIGVHGRVYGKEYCLKTGFECETCKHRFECIYGLTRSLFGRFNGIIQSISYIYGRLRNIVKHRGRVSGVEKALLSSLPLNIILGEIRVLIDALKDIDVNYHAGSRPV